MSSAVPRTTALAVVAVAAYGGAGEARLGAQTLGPNLILLDSIVLQETDDLYVGRAMKMFLGPDSSFFVIDPFANAIVRLDRNGRALRSYGGSGDGPGEFRLIGPAGFASHTVLGARDGREPRVRIEFLDLESGESSSLKPDGSGQCPDTLIPTSDLSMPTTAFRGNELFVLDRRIGGTGLRTVVRRFAVDPVNCSGEIRMEGRDG